MTNILVVVYCTAELFIAVKSFMKQDPGFNTIMIPTQMKARNTNRVTRYEFQAHFERAKHHFFELLFFYDHNKLPKIAQLAKNRSIWSHRTLTKGTLSTVYTSSLR